MACLLGAVAAHEAAAKADGDLLQQHMRRREKCCGTCQRVYQVLARV